MKQAEWAAEGSPITGALFQLLVCWLQCNNDDVSLPACWGRPPSLWGCFTDIPQISTQIILLACRSQITPLSMVDLTRWDLLRFEYLSMVTGRRNGQTHTIHLTRDKAHKGTSRFMHKALGQFVWSFVFWNLVTAYSCLFHSACSLMLLFCGISGFFLEATSFFFFIRTFGIAILYNVCSQYAVSYIFEILNNSAD